MITQQTMYLLMHHAVVTDQPSEECKTGDGRLVLLSWLITLKPTKRTQPVPYLLNILHQMLFSCKSFVPSYIDCSEAGSG